MARSAEAIAPKTSVEDTRQRILTATRELYARCGSRGTTTREVAVQAGINEATLFRHFGTKSQLIAAMLDHFSPNETLERSLDHVRSLPGIEEQLRSLAQHCIEVMREREDLIRVAMAEEIVNPDGHSCAWRAPYAARTRIAQFFEERVRAGDLQGDPLQLARVFMSLMFSYVMARKLWGDCKMPLEGVTALLAGIFLNGARAR